MTLSTHAEGMEVDVEVENHGSIFLFSPLTQPGREWIGEHVTGETTTFAGSLVVEARYARDLADGMMGDGLVLR